MRKHVTGYLLLGLLGGSAAPVWALEVKSSGPSERPMGMIEELKEKGLLVPVAGFQGKLTDTFRQPRANDRVHYALDIRARRGTPVLATDAGRIIKLFTSKAGGLTIYATDPAQRYIYYYAHLDRYQSGLREGMALQRGDTIGYVGTTGNAPANYPHLHFAIMRSYNIKRWSRGIPINPAKVF